MLVRPARTMVEIMAGRKTLALDAGGEGGRSMVYLA
jgi:hypothetical protein